MPCDTSSKPSADGSPFTGAAQSLQGATIFDVAIQNFAFSAQDIIIQRDTIVRWTNVDFAPHTSTSQSGPDVGMGDGVWDSGFLSNGETYERTFDAVNKTYYFCDVHGTSMQGTVDARSPGDASGDGAVDFTDLLLVAQHYDQNSPEPATAYAFGDFDIDGVVNFSDLLLLAQHYNEPTDLSGLDARFRHDFEFALSAVPEPMMGGLVGLGIMLMGRRRR
ncbi:MAG TPA: dockerin type I domain-containing protein [Tepidisphaeraceae bacterium]|nr:dockerin type I domain-containing protein [Tepidisphaeraceae bacterium]